MQTGDLDIGRVVGQEEDRTVELVVRVQDFSARKAIPPCLTVAINDACTGIGVDFDIPN